MHKLSKIYKYIQIQMIETQSIVYTLLSIISPIESTNSSFARTFIALSNDTEMNIIYVMHTNPKLSNKHNYNKNNK